MKLHEHRDFEQAILAAVEYFKAQNLNAAFIEKDYYVTEALRALNAAEGNAVIFKGGTSLSKGWGIIQRFSEDIDLFLDPDAYNPTLGTNAVDRKLKVLRDALPANLPLTYIPGESRTMGGLGRSDRFAYATHFESVVGVSPSVLLESGIASGRQPTADVPIQSYLGQYLSASGKTLGADNEGPFVMRLLHFRRTFVEKLFAIHKKVELFKLRGTPVGSHTRHYYDVAELLLREEVQDMLRTDEYGLIKADYDAVSRKYFPDHYHFPKDMKFSNSEAFFPPASLARELGSEYAQQCQLLCYGAFPNWGEVQSRFAAVKDLL